VPLSGSVYRLVMAGQSWKQPVDDDQVMTGCPLDVDVGPVAPESAEGRAVLAAYFHEIVSRHHGREATGAEVAAAMRAEPSDDLRPPDGLLLVARQDGRVLGCAGLRLLPAGTGEVTRVFVVPQARRQGLGQRLLDAVEAAARRQRVSRLRLDTSDYLTEAGRLYRRNGYQEVAPFSDGRVANLWYGKELR
jgi:GNAT superfamily N-acetyltransferase